MDFLKFNIYALSNPSNPKEYLLLLQEATRMVDDLNDSLDRWTEELERAQNDKR